MWYYKPEVKVKATQSTEYIIMVWDLIKPFEHMQNVFIFFIAVIKKIFWSLSSAWKLSWGLFPFTVTLFPNRKAIFLFVAYFFTSYIEKLIQGCILTMDIVIQLASGLNWVACFTLVFFFKLDNFFKAYNSTFLSLSITGASSMFLPAHLSCRFRSSPNCH